MAPLVSTLLVVSVLAMLFSNTRRLGIAAIALLTFRYPVPSLMAVAAGVAIFILIRFFK